jgi:serine-type D-Ala-D-Ala carboxypeptidase
MRERSMRRRSSRLLPASYLALGAAAALAGCQPGRAAGSDRAPRSPAEHRVAAPLAQPAPPVAAPELDGIDDVVLAALARRDVPGAVVAVVRDGAVVFERAYGMRSMKPERRPMTVDTVFDLASLTKVVATAPAVALLAQDGKLAISEPVSRYIPEFGRHGKGDITVEQLLVHTSGLIADNDLRDYADGPARAMERLYALRPRFPPGARFVYSDVGFIVLGALVERVSGEPLDAFVRRRLYAPLGMRDTTFAPTGALARRAAPTTEERDGLLLHPGPELVARGPLQGEVHDPRAYRLGGVAGHAGLFGTAGDLARFALMLMGGGALDGERVLDAASVEEMTRPRPLPAGEGLRGLGWDVQTKSSGYRGALPAGFGHTGFTGTSIWIAPARRTAVIVLSSRLHPDGRGAPGRLRREVADVVARSLAARPAL